MILMFLLLPVKTREVLAGSAGPYMGVSACNLATRRGRSHSANGFVFTGDLKGKEKAFKLAVSSSQL